MSLYLEGSILVKLLRSEPGSPRVKSMLARERDVVISSLARLEGQVAIDALGAGGFLSARKAADRRAALEKFRELPGFRFFALPRHDF